MSLPRSAALTLAMAVFGIAISGYLTWVHYQQTGLVCGLGDCETVQASEYSEIAGVPIALLGMLMFGTVAGLVLLRSLRPSISDYASAAVVFVTLAGVIYYAYLTWIELGVLEAICQWCVLSSLMALGILINEGYHFVMSDDRLTDAKSGTRRD